MENVEHFEGESGLGEDQLQVAARRQLVASLIVALVIAAFAGLVALRPAYREAAAVAPHKLASIQQPSFVTPPGAHVAALKQREIELP
jgi:hypothetical protein